MKGSVQLVDITHQLIQDLRHENDLERDGKAEFIPKLLIVEDDHLDASIMKFTLEATLREMGSKNWVIDVADNSHRAMEMINSASTPDLPDYDIVFLDLKLPGDSGVDIMREIKRISPDLPLVIVTGAVYGSQLLATAARIGYFGLVEKPLDKVDVREILVKHKIGHDTDFINKPTTIKAA